MEQIGEGVEIHCFSRLQVVDRGFTSSSLSAPRSGSSLIAAAMAE